MIPRLSVDSLNVTFPGGRSQAPHRALQDVSFRVDPGEILAVVGGSGSGKSTLARVLVRLLGPTSGRFLLDGVDVLACERTPSLTFRRRVQLIFQDPYASLNPAHTVGYHLARPLLLHGHATSATVAQASAALLHAVGLRPPTDFLGLRPFSLSGGQRQRVGIARALAPRPDLLLADEPTSMLDLSLRADLLDLLRRDRDARGTSIVFITHDLAAARYLADRILVLHEGRVVEIGPTHTVLTRPAHPYTRALIGLTPESS